MKKSAENEDLLEDGSNYQSNAYAKAAHTVDMAIVRIHENELQTLLIKRKYPPFKDKWAICGGFVQIAQEEALLDAAKRKLQSEVGVKSIPVRQLATYGDPHRDPRDRIISTVYFALVNDEILSEQTLTANEDASEVKWVSLRKSRNLAFDHRQILNDLDTYLQERLLFDGIAFELVSKKFTWTELRQVYQVVLGRELIAQNFPRDIKSQFQIIELDETKSVGRGKPARLCSFGGKVSRFK